VPARFGLVVVVAAALALASCGGDDDGTKDAARSPSTSGSAIGDTQHQQPGNLRLRSSAFAEGQPIPRVYTCQGKNEPPPLEWSGAPDDAKRLAMIVDDPDAPGGTFVHWVVWDFGPGDGSTAAGKVPAGAVEGKNGAGNAGYIGPCPPSGVHHYQFHLYALSGSPPVQPGVDAATLRNAIRDLTVATTTLTGTYQRS
jgi:Raf kinase inhibitor-like YbhB/YbcL family protein